ncbi:hypothetical protein JYT51_02165, partial [Candidatus Amoebophilus asiaticus]|nr:hypothetical protein [Candidatus Amoebophilus asiaticus]
MNKLLTNQKILTLLFGVLLPFVASSQTTLKIGTSLASNSTTQAGPVNNYYKSNHLQFVYTVNELYAAGWTAGMPGTISQIGYNIKAAPNNALPNWTVKLKATTATDASSYDGSGLTTVYTNSSYSPTAGGFEMHTFSSNFDWDGVSNILVDLCWDVSSGWSSSGESYVYDWTDGTSYVRSDASSQCGVSTSSKYATKPQIQFVITANTNAPANNTICTATSLTVNDNVLVGTNIYASTNTDDQVGSCWVGSSKSHTVWYSFTAPSDGKATINVKANGFHTLTDNQVAIFSTSGGCGGTLTEVGCDDNTGTAGCTNCASKALTGLTGGDTYYIEIDGYSTNT